jgi:hypothetical protein
MSLTMGFLLGLGVSLLPNRSLERLSDLELFSRNSDRKLEPMLIKAGCCLKNRGNIGMQATKNPQHSSTGTHNPIRVTPHVKSLLL